MPAFCYRIPVRGTVQGHGDHEANALPARAVLPGEDFPPPQLLKQRSAEIPLVAEEHVNGVVVNKVQETD